jgi:hypothetical protein
MILASKINSPANLNPRRLGVIQSRTEGFRKGKNFLLLPAIE